MAKVVSPISAIVQVIGRPKESKHQAGSYYYPTLFLIDGIDDDDHKLWKNLSGDEISQLKRGDRVQLIPAGADKSGNTKHNIVLLEMTEQPAAAPEPIECWTNARKKRLAEAARANAAFLQFCHEQVTARFENLTDQGAIAVLTAALFEQTLRESR